jgi:hypothetical protein
MSNFLGRYAFKRSEGGSSNESFNMIFAMKRLPNCYLTHAFSTIPGVELLSHGSWQP